MFSKSIRTQLSRVRQIRLGDRYFPGDMAIDRGAQKGSGLRGNLEEIHHFGIDIDRIFALDPMSNRQIRYWQLP